MTLCKDCVYCQQERYDAANRSAFRQGDDYLYYCYRHCQYVIETNTCKDAKN